MSDISRRRMSRVRQNVRFRDTEFNPGNAIVGAVCDRAIFIGGEIVRGHRPRYRPLRENAQLLVSRRHSLNRNHECGDAHAFLGGACELCFAHQAVGADH